MRACNCDRTEKAVFSEDEMKRKTEFGVN